MRKFQQYITEGVYDPSIFKAFFLAGGPGSGKSWVASRTLEGSGMKVINTDLGFERYAKQVGLDLKKMQSFTPAQTKLKDELRARSKSGTKTQLQTSKTSATTTIKNNIKTQRNKSHQTKHVTEMKRTIFILRLNIRLQLNQALDRIHLTLI